MATPGSFASLQKRLRPATRLGRIWLITFLLWLVFFSLSMSDHVTSDAVDGVNILLGLAAVVLGIPLVWRWVRTRLLWRLSNRLIVNYLLIGLAPVVLIATLVLVVGYSLAGQFAIVAATGELDRNIAYLGTENHALAMHVVHSIGQPEDPRPTSDDRITEAIGLAPHDASPQVISVYADHKLQLPPGMKADATPHLADAPAWVQGSFAGVVVDDGHFFLRAVDTLQLRGHTATVIASEPLDAARLARMGTGIGRVTLFGTTIRQDGKGRNFGSSAGTHVSAAMSSKVVTSGKTAATGNDDDNVDFSLSPGGMKVNETPAGRDTATTDIKTSITGGEMPPKRGWYDMNVMFPTLLPVRNWSDGVLLSSPLGVSSRPSALYQRLFAISNQFGNIIRIALISLAAMFALLELIALIMAARLNGTITRSVEQLYEATLRVDSGDFSHPIAVRNNDQLAELSRSFNRMTTSLERLIETQKEKERMQSELAVAQEVQNTLFPRGDIRLPQLDIHGVCRPARGVSGDYYDFLLFGQDRLGLALGDISGKGISAALLMATLHSAVRAYRFAAEEVIEAEAAADLAHSLQDTAGATVADKVRMAALFESPSKILALLNRHLYRSTQPEKYATLWLGHYNGNQRRLTYSNGGQLPPLVLRESGEIVRLDRGGTVVGLLDDQQYDEGSLVLEQGDIVVAYSDGVTEPENDFGDFGEDRLMEIVHRYRNESLQRISENVMLALDDWIGAQEQPDDITLVLARQG